MDSCIYLNNADSTYIPKEVINKMAKYMNIHINDTNKTDTIIAKFRDEIASINRFSLIGQDGYSIIFTSGASESNSTIITSTVRSFIKITNKQPHIIVSAVEHDSIFLLTKDLEMENIDVTYVPTIKEGQNIGSVDIDFLNKSIKPNTCIVSIMSANHKTGAINDIKTIGDICMRNKIPFHTDASQTFGKFPINPIETKITAFSASFHKLNGPSGIGILVIRNSFIDGYKLRSIISGNENYKLRGGIIPIHNIIGARECYRLAYTNRHEKNKNLSKIKKYTIRLLENIYTYNNIITNSIPNIIFILLKNNICQIELQKKFQKRNIIISVIDKDEVFLLCGKNNAAIRLSIDDYTNTEYIDIFIRKFMDLC